MKKATLSSLTTGQIVFVKDITPKTSYIQGVVTSVKGGTVRINWSDMPDKITQYAPDFFDDGFDPFETIYI